MAKGKYKEWLEHDNLLLLEAWARDGLTDKQIANNIGISVKTLYEWKNSYCDICESLKKGKEVVDIQVENALLKRALGYEYIEEVKERLADSDELLVTKQVKKHVLPDVAAQIFWLKNRKFNQWRDKREVENNINFKENVEENLTLEELKALAKANPLK